jgi:hypothetical protein
MSMKMIFLLAIIVTLFLVAPPAVTGWLWPGMWGTLASDQVLVVTTYAFVAVIMALLISHHN